MIFLYLPVNRCRFVITQSRKNWRPWKHVWHLFHSLLNNLQIFFTCLVPNIVWRQISGPYDIVNILQVSTCEIEVAKERNFIYSQDAFQKYASTCCQQWFLVCRISGNRPIYEKQKIIVRNLNLNCALKHLWRHIRFNESCNRWRKKGVLSISTWS